MRDIINKLKQLEESQTEPTGPQVGDEFGISFSEDLEISTTIIDVLEDGIVVQMDDNAMSHMTENGVNFYEGELVEGKKKSPAGGPACWKNKKIHPTKPTKMKGGKRVNNCIDAGTNESIEENELEAVDIDKKRDADKKWIDVARLMADAAGKISFKTDAGIELSNDIEKLADALTNAAPEETPAIGSKAYNMIKNYVMKAGMKSDQKEIMKFVDDAIKQWEGGAEFDRSKVKEPTDADAYQGMESSELDRIKSLSGVQTEGHGPEIDGFLKKVAAMTDPEEQYQTAQKAYAGKFGLEIQQAIEDMYNEAKKSVGDMDDVMDDVLDMIEKDYGPRKEDVDVDEAEYQGRKVSLGKPTRGDVKKFKVYVKNPKGNVVKVNFGDPNMKIKKSNPARRKSFRARHNCDNPGPRHKARYWSCRKW